MEKRFVLFLVLSLAILLGYTALMQWLTPPPALVAEKNAEKNPAGADDGPQLEQPEAPSPEKTPDQLAPATDATSSPMPVEASPTETPPQEPPDVATTVAPQRQWISFGSYAAGSGYNLLVTLNSQGAALERVELTARDAAGKLLYRQLDEKYGYLGHLALTPRQTGGSYVVNVVGAGTPAALATPGDTSFGVGLQQGDVLVRVDDVPVLYAAQLDERLSTKKPGETIALTVERDIAGATKSTTYLATLDVRPLELIRPEPLHPNETSPHPLSCLLTLNQKVAQDNVAITSTSSGIWRTQVAEDGQSVEFHFPLDAVTLEKLGGRGPLEIVKRYRLDKPGDLAAGAGYHLQLEVELQNQSAEPIQLAYRLDGPNGLPTEGWWYSTKIHPHMFYGAGARDVICGTDRQGFQLVGCPELYKLAKNKQPPRALFGADEPEVNRTVRFLSVDTQYFAAILSPRSENGPSTSTFARAEAFALGDVATQPKGYSRTTNVSFNLQSDTIQVPAGGSFQQQFQLFLGPKEPALLQSYGLSDAMYYGWDVFAFVAIRLGWLLHVFQSWTGNWGVAIIMLTVIVRGCMFPISRKAAKNAAMMQELAPELRKIAEKHKSDMEKRAKAQQELFRQHNYNPMGGCWLMFLQLPIFIGLYRCIAVDIKLRDAALVPGWEWSSNLAGPDQLLFWKNYLPTFLASETGLLGPYLNILPLLTVGLFLVHQKLFTPPATDEQTQMQLTMMKYMTVFMGVLFFKVAAGLCIYFIASSLWGIAERKLIPKPQPKVAGKSTPAEETKSRGRERRK